MKEERSVRSMWLRGVVCLVVIHFISVVVFATEVTICFDAGADGSVDLQISTGLDWQTDIYDNPGSSVNFLDGTDVAIPGSGGAEVTNSSFRIVAADTTSPVGTQHAVIELGFSIKGGGSDTDFKVYLNEPMNVGSIINTVAYAKAGLGLSFASGGVSFKGAYGADNDIYKADYNGSINFATLLETPEPDGYTQIGGSWEELTSAYGPTPPVYPPAGWANIGAVTEMRPEFRFTLGANTPAQTTSAFEIIGEVPEPASVLLLGLGGLSLLKRRKV